MLPEYIIFFAIALNLVGQIFYIRSIARGEARPNLVTWFVWMLAPFIAVFFQIKAGAGLSILPIFMAGFGPLIIIIAALLKKNNYWKMTTFDIYCGLLAIVALLCYVATQNLGLSIIFALLSDMLASIPTIVKSWKFPETESSSAYIGAVVSNVIGLLIIKTWSFSIYSFGVWLIVLNLGLTIIIHRKKIILWYTK